jgi:hypothetical protein
LVGPSRQPIEDQLSVAKPDQSIGASYRQFHLVQAAQDSHLVFASDAGDQIQHLDRRLRVE